MIIILSPIIEFFFIQVHYDKTHIGDPEAGEGAIVEAPARWLFYTLSPEKRAYFASVAAMLQFTSLAHLVVQVVVGEAILTQ